MFHGIVHGTALGLALTVSACAFDNGEEPIFLAPAVRAPFKTAVEERACPGEDQDTTEARQAIARVRAMTGLPPLRCDAAASAATTGHCRYLVTNGELTHFQTKGRPAFTGVTFEARLAGQAFADLPAGEVLANITGARVIEGSRGFLTSVYHRAPFLRTEVVSFGYGHVADCATIDFGRRADGKSAPEQVAIWPPDGATSVPRSFHAGAERPNPIPGADTVGYPVSVIRESPVTIISAELFGPTGSLDVMLLTTANDPAHLVRPGEVHLVPKAPLAASTQYRARFSYRAKGEATVIQTSFTTGGE